jgi:CBS domain-containing protein
MKVGDLVLQLGWEADGVGIVTRTDIERMPTDCDDRVLVQWPLGEVGMYRSQLKVISESR